MNEPLYQHTLSRRTVLRGLGASLTLPFLPSLAWAVNPGSEKNAAPRRLATFIFANGVNEFHWTQEVGPGNAIKSVGSSLQPLVPHHSDILYLNNLRLFEETPGIHRLYFDNFLTGKRNKNPRGLPKLEESLDWRVAREVGKTTPVPVLPLSGNGGQTMSWSSPTTPVPPETRPRRAFDRLFDTTSLERDRSVLDYVNREAKRVRGDLDVVDQRKLDEYLDSIREIERRIELATSDDRHTGWQPSLAKPDMERPEAGRPDDFGERTKLLLDIAVLALQMDKTRVVNYLFENDVGGQQFNFIKGVSRKGHHDISHHRKREDELEDYRRIVHWHVEQFAYVIEKAKAIDEGNGTTLFDNTMMLFGTTMFDGDIHDHQRLPLVLAGGSSAGIKGGRVLTYEKEEDRRLCNLHLDLARRMGCADWNDFGNSHYPLPGIGG